MELNEMMAMGSLIAGMSLLALAIEMVRAAVWAGIFYVAAKQLLKAKRR